MGIDYSTRNQQVAKKKAACSVRRYLKLSGLCRRLLVVGETIKFLRYSTVVSGISSVGGSRGGR